MAQTLHPNRLTLDHRNDNMTNELPNLSDHVLNWLKSEEDISNDFRNLIESELLRRSLERNTEEPITTLHVVRSMFIASKEIYEREMPNG